MSKIDFFFSSHSFSSSGRTDLQKYSNSPSWSTDSKNVYNIFVGPGVQVQFVLEQIFRELHFFGNFSFFSRPSSSLNWCWTWTPEPIVMLFTFLESVLQDGEFEYFWRSVQPLEEKLYEFQTIILKIVKNFEKSSKI